MFPQGHAAINLLLLAGTERMMTRLSPRRMTTRELALPVLPALAAAVIPDVADKIVCDVLHWAPYGRKSNSKQGHRYLVGSVVLWEFIAIFWDMEPFVWTLRHYGRVP